MLKWKMTTRRWIKIGAGKGTAIISIISLFIVLSLLYNFEIQDVTGDISCDGTKDDPCISRFNVKNPNAFNLDVYSKDQVKLDFAPGIQDYALFTKDGRCSATGSCRCDLKDGSKIGFKGWRCTDFTNKTKPRKDKVYNFRFRAYSKTKFLLYGLKNNPDDVIKWGVGFNNKYLDPEWGSYSVDSRIKIFKTGNEVYYNVEAKFINSTDINITICSGNLDDKEMKIKQTPSGLEVTNKDKLTNESYIIYDNLKVKDMSGKYTKDLTKKLKKKDLESVSEEVETGDIYCYYNTITENTRYGENTIYVIIEDEVTDVAINDQVTSHVNFSHTAVNQTGENYIKLNGEDGYINVGDILKTVCSDQQCTFSAWVNRDGTSAGNHMIIGKYDDTNGDDFIRWSVSANALNMVITHNGTLGEGFCLEGDGAVGINDWTHVVSVWNKTHLSNYVDGVLQGTAGACTITIDSEAWDDAENVFIGARDSTSVQDFMNGSIDDVQVFKDALTQSEITNLYNINRSDYNGSKVSLIGEWNFDNGLFYKDAFGSNDGTGVGNIQMVPDTSIRFVRHEPYNTLIAYWNFDMDNNVSAYDFSTQKSTGVYTGNAVTGAGVYDNSLVVDGASGTSVSVPDSSLLQLQYPLTISFWTMFSAAQSSSDTYMGKWTGSAATSAYKIGVGRGYRLAFSTSDADGSTTVAMDNALASDGIWRHVLISWNGSDVDFYKNGVLDSTKTNTRQPKIDDGSAFSIGQDSDGSGPFNGNIDEVMLFDSALNSSQVSDIYNNQSSRYFSNGTKKLLNLVINKTGNPNRINMTVNCKTLKGSACFGRVGTWELSDGYDDIDNNLVGSWHLDNNPLDSSGNGNDGTTSGNILNSTGRYNGSYEFDGETSHIEVPASTSINISKAITLSAWVKPKGTNVYPNRIIDKTGGGAAIDYALTFGTTNKVHILMNAPGWVDLGSSVNAIPNNNWTYVSATYDGSYLSIYVNGIFDNGVAHTGDILTNDLALRFGERGAGGHKFNGTIDEVRIWNRSLNADEVLENYIEGSAKFQIVAEQELTSGIPEEFEIPGTTENILPIIILKSGTNHFYPATLFGDVTVETFAVDDEVIVIPYINISFTEPTPPDGITTANTSVLINISINATYLEEVVFNWNGTNFTYYNKSLMLMMNFDNIPAIGDSGNKTVDVSLYSNNGTCYQTGYGMDCNYTDGRYGQAIFLNGQNESVIIPDNYSLNNMPLATITYWQKLDTLAATTIPIAKDGDSGYYVQYDSGGTFKGRYGNNFDTLGGSGSIKTVVWQHIAVTYDGTNVEGYINGNFTGSFAATAPSGMNDPLFIGGYGANGASVPTAYWVDGAIDAVRIWNYSMDKGQIYQQYIGNLHKYDIDKWYLYLNQSYNATDGLTNGEYTYRGYATNDSMTWNMTEIRTITIGGAADTCTYTSGDWDIDCADDCVISSPVDVGGNDIFITGTGTFTTNADIIAYNLIRILGTDQTNRCIVTCRGGCFKNI